MENIKQVMIQLVKMLQKRKRIVLALSCLVVFMTTYLLILPAFTLEKDEAIKQGGIDIGTEESADVAEETADVSEEAADAAEEPADVFEKTNADPKDAEADQAESNDVSGSDEASEAKDADKAEEAPERVKAETAKAEPYEQPKADAAKADDTPAGPITFEGDGFSVAVEDTAGVLPEKASVEVKELVEDPTEGTKAERKAAAEEYRNYYEKALEAVNDDDQSGTVKKFSFVKFYDITLQAGDETIQPEKPVNVTISYDKQQQKDLQVEKKKDVRIIHFAEDKKNGEVTAELLDKKSVDVTLESSKMTETSFEAESFSVYAVVYTVDLRTYVVSDSGDTYEVNVTYDETAGIPEDAELRVREISKTEKEYEENVKATNKQLKAQNEPEINDPVQFDISIISNGKEVEPKEGSTVNVEIKLVPEVFNKEQSGNTQDKKSEKNNISDDEGEIWYNGERVDLSGEEGETNYTVSHIKDDGKAEIIGEVNSSVDSDERIVLEFSTDSFSDYTVSDANGINGLPDRIYVGDVIYLFNMESTTFSNNGTVKETRFSGKYREIRAENAGTFTITKPSSGWWDPTTSKTITVLPARTGTTPPPTIETIDNASIGLTLNLFDYDLDDYLNDRFNNQDYGSDSTGYFDNHGINAGHALKFWGSGIGHTDTYGSQNQYDAHGVQQIVKTDLNTGRAGGYPVLRSDSTNLQYLFDPSVNTNDRRVYQNVNGLFKKDGDYYVYDSNQNYAWYNPTDNKFEVYNRTYYQHQNSESGGYHTPDPKPIGFFPFHKWDEDYDLYVNWNKQLNHHFGMAMSVDFTLPKDPKAVKDSNGQPIVFNFSGDDDLWVFIDGKLAMDIGGIHQPTAGTIDFLNHQVSVQNGDTESNTRLQLTQAQFNERFANPNGINLYDGNKHTLEVFYIERGGCDSNCRIRFNMTQYGDVEFDKVDADEENTKLAGAVFGLYKDAECRIPLMEELTDGSSRAFVVETDEHGHAKIEDVPLGDYYLKEIHAPEGYPLTVGGETARVRVYLDGSGNVKASVNGVETGAKITNKKPNPIYLDLRKEWHNAEDQTIAAPDGVTAKFALKRIRKYTIQTEEKVEKEKNTSHLTVGWLHNNTPHIYEEFDLVAGSQATVSWSLNDGYTGTIGCEVNGTIYTKSANPNNVYSQVITMPAAGQTSILYIIDESENGDAIKNINVAGDQFHGNSGGGYIHHFHTLTDTDPGFSEEVTLPINGNTWEHRFNNLPTFGTGTVNVALEEGGEVKSYDVAFQYSYYIEEVSSTAPAGTTVIYKDTHNNVINSAIDAETHTSGTETVINKVPFGYLKIQKKVTYNGSDQNLTAAQKSKMAGDYKFKIYTKEACGDGDAVQDPDAAADATDKDLIITVTIRDDGQAVSSAPIKLLAGKYWIKEVESSNPAMFPVDNPIEVTVTKDHTTASPVISSLTNNYDENNGPDKIAIDIEKKFQGLDDKTQVPANFQVLLQYTLNGDTKTVTLNNTELDTGENGEKITWTESADGFTWHWKVTNIPSEAKDFKIKEENYDKAKGYDWKSATLNGNDITSSVTSYHDLTVTAPAAQLSNVTSNRRTSDSGQNTEFYLEDDDILLTKLTANQGTLVISKKPLNLAERNAVENNWPNQFKEPPHYFSIEEHPNGFAYGDKTVTFGEKNGKTTVKFTQNASAQETVYAVTYSSQDARNNANLVNVYEEVPVTIDIIKVDKTGEVKLKGAVFTIRQLADKGPTENGTFYTKEGTTPSDSAATDENGKTSFGNLTHGYYEITEKTAPAGYIIPDDTALYFKIDSGVVTWLEKGAGKPSTWTEKSTADMVSFEAAKAAEAGTPATNATFTVKNEPGAALPNSGGIGTTIFYIFGSMLVIGCGVVLISRRRLSGNGKDM